MENDRVKLFCNLSTNVAAMVWTKSDGRTHARTYIHQTVTETTMSCLTRAGSKYGVLHGSEVHVLYTSKP